MLRRISGTSALVFLAISSMVLLDFGPGASGIRIQDAKAADPPAISLGVTTIGEGDDFATRVLGLPWNMETNPYPDIPTTFTNFDRSSFTSSSDTWSIDGGVDPNVWVHYPGIIDTQQALKIGNKVNIDADRYHLFSVRMCSNIADGAVIYWYLDQFGEIPLRIGYWDPPVSVNQGCEVYVFDLSQAAYQQEESWQGDIPGLRFDPVNFNSPSTIEFDWFRLTTADLSNIVPINWSNVTSGTNLHFYANTSCSSSDAIPLGVISRAGMDSGTFSWGSSLLPNGGAGTPYPLPESLEPGSYTILLRIDGSGSPICASSQLEIRQAPILEYIKPSMQSGTDYATLVVGDAWGMSNSEDITMTNDVTSSTFSSGVWDGTTNSDGDPWAHLNVPVAIDASKYRYATLRMWLEGEPPSERQFHSIQRWIWWYLGPGIDAAATEDMLIHTGWQTYPLDLSQALIDPSSTPGSSWTGSPSVFRLDIHEEAKVMDFHVDYILLTSGEEVEAGTPFPILYNVLSQDGPSVTFYYDVDSNPDNGRTLMEEYSQPPNLHPNLVYLPLTVRNHFPEEIVVANSQSWVWDTSGVVPDTYYVSADVADGVNTTTWYSEIPIEVTN